MSEDGQFEIVNFEEDGLLVGAQTGAYMVKPILSLTINYAVVICWRMASKKDIEIIETGLVVEMKGVDMANKICGLEKSNLITEVENLQKKLSEANEKLKEMELNSKAKEMALIEEMGRLKEELREIKEERKTTHEFSTWKAEIESHLNEIKKQVEILNFESSIKNQHETVLKDFTFTYFDNSLIRNIDSTIVTFGRTIYSRDVFCNLFIDEFKSVESICRKLVEHAFDKMWSKTEKNSMIKQFVIGGFLPVADGLLNRWAELIVVGYSLRSQAGQDEKKLADLMWALRKHLKSAVECFCNERKKDLQTLTTST